MRFALIFWFSCLTLTGYSQRKFIVGANDEYSILLNENVSKRSLMVEGLGNVDYYILRQSDSSFVYMLSIKKAGVTNDPMVIYSDDFRNTFIDQCGCEISRYLSIRRHDSIILKP